MEQFDTHLHLTDPRLWKSIDSELEACEKMGITGFLNAGFNQEDWMRQKVLQSKWTGILISCWGLHPYWIAENSTNGSILESEWNFLLTEQSSFQAIGETGFDLRPKFKSSFELQEVFFRKSVELHLESKKPMILHLVKSNNEAIKLLKSYGKNFEGIVHSFSGNYEEAKILIDLGLKISFSGSSTYKNASRIRDAVKNIPENSLLIETDSPDQRPFGFDDELNHSWSLSKVAEEIALIRSVNPQDIIDTSNKNFKKLFQL